MKEDLVKQFISIRETLLRERTGLEARLREIDAALGERPVNDSPSGKSASAAFTQAGVRHMSPATRAKIAAAARARWARVRNAQGPVAVSAGSPKRRKRQLSPEHRAKIAAGARARWARARRAAA